MEQKVTFYTEEKVYLTCLTLTEHSRIFETEIHKKKYLDSLAECMGREELIAYCVLDDQSWQIIRYRRKDTAEQESSGSQRSVVETPERFLSAVCALYEKKLTDCGQVRKNHADWCMRIKEICPEQVEEEIIRIHFLPVTQDYVIRAEDYWWSSFQEYLGRGWLPFSIAEERMRAGASEYLIRKNIRALHARWKKEHKVLKKR